MVYPNLRVIMTFQEMSRLIPEGLKHNAWQRAKDSNGDVVYSQRTWRQMVNDVNYIAWYGKLDKYKGATWKGKSIGNVTVVLGMYDLSVDNIEALARERFTVLTANQLEEFKLENINNIK